jgi:hypothetical protein
MFLGCRAEKIQSPRPETSGKSNAKADDLPIPRFVDVTTKSGISAIYRNGEETGNCSYVESLGGGVGVSDFDGDGLMDLFFPGGGTIQTNEPLRGIPGTMWRNRGQMAFDNATRAAALDRADNYTHGCAIADLDNDGFPDLLVTGYGGLQLFRNQGDGTFVESREPAGLLDDSWSSSAAWGDFDGDGNLDLYVVHYVDWSWQNHPYCQSTQSGKRDLCAPADFAPLSDVVYFSRGDGTFGAASGDVGLAPGGKGLGVIAADVNLDAKLDVYVANDTTPNFLLINQGNGRFQERGVSSGTAFDQRGIPNGSMGLAVFDYDHDLQPDIWVTNYERETFGLYHNDGGGAFRCLTEAAGIASLGTLFVGFGTVAADFSHRGQEDLVVSNGHIMKHPGTSTVAQVPLYLGNDGNGRFERLPFPDGNYFAEVHRGRGVVAADLDRDGWLDLVFSHVEEPATVLQQQHPQSGGHRGGDNWLGLRLIGRRANRDAIGAHVILTTTAGKQYRTIVGGGSYLSQNPYEVRFGWPDGATAVEAQITWPSGDRQIVTPLTPGAVSPVLEPTGGQPNAIP